MKDHAFFPRGGGIIVQMKDHAFFEEEILMKYRKYIDNIEKSSPEQLIINFNQTCD